MNNYSYFPIIKTRDAELKCFSNLSKKVFSSILPIYELTKSRRTKIAPDGDIHRRMKQIEEIQAGNPFILDLSVDDRYLNPQIEQLLSNSNGFQEWYYFISDLFGDLNIVPAIHIYEDEHSSLADVELFVSRITEHKSHVALRLPYDIDNIDFNRIMQAICGSLKQDAKLSLILDAGHIEAGNSSFYSDQFVTMLKEAEAYSANIANFVVATSSFPSNVVRSASADAYDATGDFPVDDEHIFGQVLTEFPDAKYGDYASVNIEQIEMKGGTFVPRIDILTEDGTRFFYKRFRRNEGSYPECARYVLADKRYNRNNDWWSSLEISLAADGKPSGISPSHWISVRMHYYINTKILIRQKDSVG